MSALPSWARRGQKVVCIKVGDWKPLDYDSGAGGPRFGDIVTIAKVVRDPGMNWWLAFNEHHPRDVLGLDRFRPLAEDSTEAELYRARRPPAWALRERADA